MIGQLIVLNGILRGKVQFAHGLKLVAQRGNGLRHGQSILPVREAENVVARRVGQLGQAGGDIQRPENARSLKAKTTNQATN